MGCGCENDVAALLTRMSRLGFDSDHWVALCFSDPAKIKYIFDNRST